MSDACIINGHIIDPANGIDEVGNLFIADGKIAKVDTPSAVHQLRNF